MQGRSSLDTLQTPCLFCTTSRANVHHVPGASLSYEHAHSLAGSRAFVRLAECAVMHCRAKDLAKAAAKAEAQRIAAASAAAAPAAPPAAPAAADQSSMPASLEGTPQLPPGLYPSADVAPGLMAQVSLPFSLSRTLGSRGPAQSICHPHNSTIIMVRSLAYHEK